MCEGRAWAHRDVLHRHHCSFELSCHCNTILYPVWQVQFWCIRASLSLPFTFKLYARLVTFEWISFDVPVRNIVYFTKRHLARNSWDESQGKEDATVSQSVQWKPNKYKASLNIIDSVSCEHTTKEPSYLGPNHELKWWLQRHYGIGHYIQ